ncbi:hypothetical protein KP509_38G044000 [Ceratopteris richardii]|uniref:Uncharacterized protein n=1 Tax=Ceratopteris richardii TaxID=49495 RepID=A0A8T2Q3C5_CERRI|nr:hypothetical protein KP509_38G044000 [Ceratopteris richardii]
MHIMEASTLHFGLSCRQTCSPCSISARAFSTSFVSFAEELSRKQASEISKSLHVSFMSKYQSIVLFPSVSLACARTVVSFRCCAKPSKLSVVGHSVLTTSDSVPSDDESLSMESSQGTDVGSSSRKNKAPANRPSRVNTRNSAKDGLSSQESPSEIPKLSSEDVEATRSKLERLSVEEPALFKYINQVTTEDVSVDHIVSYVSSLMGIARVSWNEAVAMLSKAPAILNIETTKLEESVDFLKDMGLSQEDISAVLVMHPAFFEYDTKEMRKSVEYLISIGLPEDDVAIIIGERPQALNAKTQDVIYSMECLLEAQVLPEDFTRILSRAPDLFSPSSREHLKSRLHFFKQVGLKGGSLGKGIARRPNLLHFDLDAMKQAYNYLSEFLPPSDVAKLVCRFAEVLVIDQKRKMEPMVNHLLRLGVKPSNLGKVLLRRPQLLGYTISGLEPTISYLKELGVTDKMLGRVISISPQVLTLNCDEKLKPVVEYLRSIGLQEKKDMERLLVRNAQLLCCSIDKNIAPKFNFFLNIGVKKEDVVKILVLFPSMFGQSIELSLEPKYRYLVDVMKRSTQEIVDFPQYFGYSLQKRIKPRYERLAERGITSISLPSMLACVEADFVSRYLVGPPPSRAPYNLKKAPRRSKYTD